MRATLGVGLAVLALVVSCLLLLGAFMMVMSTIFPIGPDAYDGLSTSEIAAIERGRPLLTAAAAAAVVASMGAPVAALGVRRVGLAAATLILAATASMILLARAAGATTFVIEHGVRTLTVPLDGIGVLVSVVALVPIVRFALDRRIASRSQHD